MRRQSKPTQGKRAVGYIRVSNDSQIDGFSLDAQRSEIERWCRQRGYVLVETYADEGVSARTDKIAKRPALLRLLEDADLGNFDIVVVSMLNRWARNMGVQRQALSRLGEAKVGFALFATRIEDVIDFADQKLTMPPKSTWFDPKPLDGLVTYDFE